LSSILAAEVPALSCARGQWAPSRLAVAHHARARGRERRRCNGGRAVMAAPPGAAGRRSPALSEGNAELGAGGGFRFLK